MLRALFVLLLLDNCTQWQQCKELASMHSHMAAHGAVAQKLWDRLRVPSNASVPALCGGDCFALDLAAGAARRWASGCCSAPLSCSRPSAPTPSSNTPCSASTRPRRRAPCRTTPTPCCRPTCHAARGSNAAPQVCWAAQRLVLAAWTLQPRGGCVAQGPDSSFASVC